MFRNKQFSVKRRFSDFLGLYEKLSEKHAQNGFIVPPPPEKSLIGEQRRCGAPESLLLVASFVPKALQAGGEAAEQAWRLIWVLWHRQSFGSILGVCRCSCICLMKSQTSSSALSLNCCSPAALPALPGVALPLLCVLTSARCVWYKQIFTFPSSCC